MCASCCTALIFLILYLHYRTKQSTQRKVDGHMKSRLLNYHTTLFHHSPPNHSLVLRLLVNCVVEEESLISAAGMQGSFTKILHKTMIIFCKCSRTRLKFHMHVLLKSGSLLAPLNLAQIFYIPLLSPLKLPKYKINQ